MMSATAAETVPDLEANAAAPNDGPKAEIGECPTNPMKLSALSETAIAIYCELRFC